ncbi:MAG: permease [Armatimonadetes bacterium]|nr:permease [Armatimonadota bacterium]
MIKRLADWIVFDKMGLVPKTHFGEAVDFFIYDLMKIFLLLIVIVYAVAIIRSYFPPERARKILGGKREFGGTILAALLGIVTPVCSCSACPLFIGFVESGIPLGVSMSFLISSPTVNEVALIMLWGLFGWKVGVLYMTTGVAIAIVAGWVIGRMHLEDQIEEYVLQFRVGGGQSDVAPPTWTERHQEALDYTKGILKRVGPFVVIGIALGAVVHGYVPVDFVVRVAGRGNPFAVPIAVLIGLPLYSNAAGTIPIVQALIEKGLPLGTALALMMSIVAISIPEMIILRRVVKWKLLYIFAAVVAVAIVMIGYLFNAVLPAIQ